MPAVARCWAACFMNLLSRTNLSFSTAMMRLGGSVVGFSDPNATSASKGETLKDTINMVSSYADMIVMRNPREGAAKVASMYSSVPVINAGDGGHLHPTQTLADMITILRMRGSADDMKIGLCGEFEVRSYRAFSAAFPAAVS